MPNQSPHHQLYWPQFVQEFRNWLVDENLTLKTIRNYVSDLYRFSEWLQAEKQLYSPADLTSEQLEEYFRILEKKGTPSSTRARKLATLRRFRQFLQSQYPSTVAFAVPDNPNTPSKTERINDRILTRFALALKGDGCKETSIKNYLTDISLFAKYYADQPFHEISTKPKVAGYLAAEKRNGLSEATIQRKRASLKRFMTWAAEEEYIEENPFASVVETKLDEIKHRFLPLAFFTGLRSAPATPPTSGKEITQRLLEGDNIPPYLRWYYRYHEWRVSSYLHLSILVIFSIMIAIFGYQQFFVNVTQQFAFPSEPTAPGRILSFQGRLTDSSRTPITTPINFEFRLFDDENAGTELWDSTDTATCTVDPDQDGVFSVLLGDNVITGGCGGTITENVFSENSEVWLEVTVSGETLDPRQRIASVAYALNSETLQGFPPSLDGGINTIPVINALGEIIIGADSPSLIASSGAFLIQAESLLFQTETGTDGDISFQPDGNGSVQVLSSTTDQDSLYITNANLTTGNLIYGEVTNDNDTFNLISLAAGSTPDEKFVVDALGNVTADGWFTGRGASLSAQIATDVVTTIRGATGQTANLTEWEDSTGTVLSAVDANGYLGIGTASPGTFLDIAGNGEAVIIGDGTDTSVNISLASDRAQFGYNSSYAVVQGGSGNGIQFNVNNDTFGSGPAMTITSGGDVAIGTGLPNAKLDVDGDILATTIGLGGISSQAYNAISDSGTATFASTDNDLYVEDILEVDGQLYVGGQLIEAVEQYWQLNAEVLSPVNSSYDLAIGGTATSSAVAQIFAVGNEAGYLQARGATLSAVIASDVTLTLEATTGQSGNLTQWRNAAGTVTTVVDAAGNLGVGTDSPNYTLDVDGTGFFSGNLTVGANGTNTTFTKVGNVAGDQFLVDTTGEAIIQRSSTGLDALSIQTSGDAQPRFVVSSDGQLKWGSGSVLPDITLERSATGILSLTGGFVVNEGGASAYDFRVEGDTNANLLFVDADNNRVGVGTGSPASLFSVGPSSQLQVDASGNITTTGDLAVNGDDITSDGALDITSANQLDLVSTTGNIRLDAQGDIELDADGSDIFFQDGGSTFASFTNLSSDLLLSITGGDLLTKDAFTLSDTATLLDGKLNVQGAVGNALVMLDEEGDQNILTASASGTTVANLERTGNLLIEGSIADLSDTILTVDDDLRIQGNDIYDSGGVAVTFDGSQNTTLYGTLTLPNANVLTGLANYVQFSKGISVGGGTTYYIDSSGNANLNAITGAGLLDINGTGTNDIAGTLNLSGGILQRSGGNLTVRTTTSGDIAVESAGNLTFDDGNTTSVIPLSLTDQDLSVFPVAERALVDALNYLYNEVQAAGGGGGGDSYWGRSAQGLLYPNQDYESVSIGGNSTASAKFHFNAVTGLFTLANDATIDNTVDGTLAFTEPTIQIAASTAFDIDSPTLDLTTQSVDVDLIDATIDALNFESNLLSFDTSNSRIGIGTAAPASLLHVSGNGQALTLGDGTNNTVYANLASDRTFLGYDGSYAVLQGGLNKGLRLNVNSSSFGNGTALSILSNKNVGIGTTSPSHLLEVAGGYAGKALVSLNDTFGNDIFTASASGATRFTIANNGLITLVNGATIDNTVDGTLTLTEPTVQVAAATAFDIDSPTIDLSTQATDVTLAAATIDALNFGSDLLSFDTNNSRIGIGTAAPGAKLEVNDGGDEVLFGSRTAGYGAIGFGATLTSTNYSLSGDGTDTLINSPGASGDILFRNQNNTIAALTESGFLRIGNATTPTARLSLYQNGSLSDTANGIQWGTDVNLYRPEANVLKTDDRFVTAAGLVIDADSDALPTDVEFYLDGDFSASGQVKLGNYAGDPGYNIGSGSLAYDSSDNVVKYFDGTQWFELAGEGTTNWYFDENNVILYPRNIEADLAVGGYSTASAKFHVNADTGDIKARAATFSGSVQTSDQLQLASFASDPTALGAGSLYFNSSDNRVYYFDGTQWFAFSSAGTGVWYLDEADGTIRPNNINPDILLGGHSTSSAKLRFSQTDGSIYVGEDSHRIYEAAEPLSGNNNLRITSTGDYLYVEPDLRVAGGDIYQEYQGDVSISIDETNDETRFSGLINATDHIKNYSLGDQYGELYTQDTGSMNKIWTTSADFNASGTLFDSGLENPATNDELKLSGSSGDLTKSWTTTADFEAGTKTGGIEDPSTNDELALEATSSAWVYRDWPMRQGFDIAYTGGETLQEYQVLLDGVDTASLIGASKMNSDCSDMRFGDDAGNELDFYVVHDTCNTSDTEIWVQTESFTSSGETVHMYYGNSSAADASSIAAAFSYDSERTVGYVVHDQTAAQTIDIYSLADNNSVTIGTGTVSLDSGQSQSLAATNFDGSSAVSAKGLFQADADVTGTEMVVPVSFAGKEFAFYDRNTGNNTICMLSPWGTANVTIYDDGVNVYSGSVTSTATCTDINMTNSNVRISSDIPILVAQDNAESDTLVLRPLVKNEYLYGVGSVSLAVNTGAEASTNATTEDESTGGNRTFSLSAHSSDITSNSTYGSAPAHRLISTDASISGQQYGDGDGGESTIFYERKELSTVFGSRNGADYISIAAPYASTQCTLTRGNATLATTTGSANTDVNHIGFGTGNSSSYVTDEWTLTCDQPVYAYYQQIDTDDEHNLWGYPQMRQFTYPTPSVGAASAEEHIFFTTGEQTWTSATYDSGGAGNFTPSQIVANWQLDGSDNIAPKFQIRGAADSGFTTSVVTYPGSGLYYQDGGANDINNGSPLSISTDGRRYWQVLVLIDTGAYDADTPTVQDVSLIGAASFLPGEQAWTSNYVVSGTGNQTQNLQFGQPNRLKANWQLDGSDNIAPKFQLLVATNPSFTGAITLPNGTGTYYQDGGTYDINNGQEVDISAQVTAAGASLSNWSNSKYYWKVVAYLDTGSDRNDTPIIYDIQLRNHRPLVLQQYGFDVGIGIATTEATLHVEATNSGDVFKLTDDGEQLLKVDNEGNVTFGSSTNNDVELTVYGDIFSADETNVNTDLTNIVATHLYDTTLDRDGGAWRKSSISQTLSWYRESHDDGIGSTCDLSTDDRCGKNAFPAKANIVVTNDAVFIFDVSTNEMWMKFEQGANTAMGAATNNDFTSITARDGRIFLGTNGSSDDTGIYEIDFTTDTLAYWDTNGRVESNQTISERNDATHAYQTNLRTMFALSNSKINDLDITYHQGQRYLATATNGGMNVISLDQKLQYEFLPASSDLNGDTITDDGNNGNGATNAFDFDGTTHVRSNAADNTLIVTYQFQEAVDIRRYRVRTDDTILSTEAPEDWTFEASNDGSNWTTLDTVTDFSWYDTGTETQYYTRNINSDGTEYAYYRVNVTDPVTAGADQVWISDIVLETRREKPAVKLFANDISFAKPRTSSDSNLTNYSPRRVNDWRRINASGDHYTYSTGHDLTPWYQVSMQEPMIATTYAVMRGNDSDAHPTAWTLYGSNDGITWTSLDSQAGQTFSTYAYNAYSFTNSTAYQHYRLDVTSNGGDTTLTELGDFQIGAPVVTASSSNNNTSQDETNTVPADSGATGYYWISGANCAGGVCNEWLQHDYGTRAPVLNAYAVKGYATAGRQIEAWTLQGSNDAVSWTNLHTKADTGNPFSSTSDVLTYSFANSTGYRYYRLNITGNGGNAYVDLRGFWMLGADDRVYSESQFDDSTNDPQLAFDRGDINQYNSAAENSGDGHFLEKAFAYGISQTVSGIRYQANSDTDTRGPRDWTLQASNDRLSWTTLATRDGQTQIDDGFFGNDNEYRFYRFVADANNGDANYLRVDELYLAGGVYHNVRFAGTNLVGTNGSKGTVDVYYDVWDDYASEDEVFPTPDIELDSTPGTFDQSINLIMPSLTGIPEYSTKYALEVDGGEVYFGHRHGTDLILLAPSQDPDGQGPKVKLRGNYNTTQNVTNTWNLSHYWPMNEPAEATQLTNYGTSGANSFFYNIVDPGTAPTSVSNGKLGRAYDFDATGSTDDYIIINDVGISELDRGSGGQWSIGGWVYPETGSAVAPRAIMGTYYSYACGVGTCIEGFYLAMLDGNTPYMGMCPGTEGGGCPSVSFDQSSVPYDEWSHIVVQNRNGTGEVYINGELRQTFTVSSITDGQHLYLGVHGVSLRTSGWQGMLDEMFINYNALTPDQVQTMYERGNDSDYEVAVTDADIASTSTIGDSSLSLDQNRFRGAIVEITGGTGAGQTRLITKNSSTTLTVSPKWSTLPDTTSDFEVTALALPGSVNQTKAIRPEQKDLFLGLNNTTDGGGVVRINKSTGIVTDYYHADAGKQDDNGNSWSTGSGNDDIVGIETTQDNLIIASEGLYWREKLGDTLFEAVDKLQQALSGVMISTHSQDSTGADRRDSTRQVIRKGWSWIEENDNTRDVAFGISYQEAPLVFLSEAGFVRIAGNKPSNLADCNSGAGAESNLIVGNITNTGFTVGETATYEQHCFTWMSMGSYESSIPEGSFGGGADLAEWYGTDDETLRAGEIVSIDQSGDIKVVRSSQERDPGAIGIIATQPAITLGQESGLTPGYVNDPQLSKGAKSAVQVALAGRVPVKVSLENGPIKPGDSLTTSSTPGVAAKAVKAGPTIGKAMEAFDGSSTIIGIAAEDAGLSPDLVAAAATMSAKPGQLVASASATIKELERQAFAELNSGIGTIMAFVNTSYFDPNYATEEVQTANAQGGSFAIDSNGKLVGLGAYSFDIVDAVRQTTDWNEYLLGEFGDIASQSASPAATLADRETVLDAALARLKNLGTLALRELNVAQARVLDTLFARRIESDEIESQQIATDLLRPLSGADLVVELGNEASGSGQFIVFDDAGNQLAAIDNSGLTTRQVVAQDMESRFLSVTDLLRVNGNASVSGTLAADNISARRAQLTILQSQQLDSQDASISGTLFANEIRANSISGLEERVRSLVARERDAMASASAIPTVEPETENLIADLLDSPLTTPDSDNDETQASSNTWLSTTSDIALTGLLTTDSLRVNDLIGIGSSTTLASRSLDFTVADSCSLDALDGCGTFYLQPSGRGQLSLLADAVVISEHGGVTVNADARFAGRTTFAGTTEFEGSLFANLVQPLPNNDLEIALAGANTTTDPNQAPSITPSDLIVRGVDNQEVAAFSASGSSRFRRLIIASEEATNEGELTTSVTTNATTGVATLSAGETRFTIRNTNITDTSLIYLTPTSSTKNRVLYVSSKRAENPDSEDNEGQFTVALDESIDTDIQFNWWIIN